MSCRIRSFISWNEENCIFAVETRPPGASRRCSTDATDDSTYRPARRERGDVRAAWRRIASDRPLSWTDSRPLTGRDPRPAKRAPKPASNIRALASVIASAPGVSDQCSSAWPMAQTYAATAATSRGESGAPPKGGMTPSYCLGCATPLTIVEVSAGRLPSLHSQWPELSAGPTVLPPPSDP